MPATSIKQREYFGWLEHSDSPEAKKKRAASDMTHQQMHDFAATKDKGLPLRAKGSIKRAAGR